MFNMNFLDTYEIAGTTTPPVNQTDQSLNEEVSQVIGQLGRFWGGFRKQSQTALEAARKDLTGVVAQAQKELGKLTHDGSIEESSRTEHASRAVHELNSQDNSSSEAGSITPSAVTTPSNPEPSTFTSGLPTLFSRLQSALPPNIVTTVQNNLPETLRHASENIDLGQLRMTLSSEFQRVQGVTRAQAEEYVHRSEGMLREAMKEAGQVLKEAVKVVPPEETGPAGLVWDGTDAWMLPSEQSSTSTGKGKGREMSQDRQSGETQRARASRAESLLKRLKHNSDIIRHDPMTDYGVREMYAQWLAAEVDAEGGIDNDSWAKKIVSALNESGDGGALHATHDELVPTHLTDSDFWKRYFFRVYQIEDEEGKRKALLQGSIESEEDFSWEDEEEAASPTSPTKYISSTEIKIAGPTQLPLGRHPNNAAAVPETATFATPEPTKPSASSSRAQTPANTSPRESSEESYDLVSGNVSGNGEEKASKREDDADDADSDWE